MEDLDEPLSLERTFKATPSAVFKAWADPEIFRQWMNPGDPLIIKQWNFEPGGTCHVQRPIQDGNLLDEHGIFVIIDEPNELIQSSPDATFVLKTNFEPTDEGTLMKVTATGIPAEHHEMARDGWGLCFDKLAQHLEGN